MNKRSFTFTNIMKTLSSIMKLTEISLIIKNEKLCWLF